MYSIPYIILFAILFFLYLCECKKINCGISIKTSQTITFILLLIFIGLRGHIYSDFISYYPYFQALPNIFQLSKQNILDFIFEPGFTIYSSLIKTIMPNYFGWVFINTFIDLLVFSFVFKRYTNSIILPFIFFIAFNGLLMEFNLYRNVKALDLFLLSIPYLEKRKLVPYIILNLLGYTFHMSSIIYFPLYFLLSKNISKKVIWGGIIFANIIFLFKISMLNDFLSSFNIFKTMSFYDKLYRHIDNSEVGQVFSVGYFERTFSVILFTSLYNRLTFQSKSNIIFYNCFLLYYILFLCFYEVQVLVDRVPALFMFSYWILYPNTLFIKYKNRKLLFYITIFLVLIKIFLSNNIPPAKYDNVLFGIESYENKRIVYENY